MTATVKKILSHYESDCPGTKANLARILSRRLRRTSGILAEHLVDGRM